jgi:hypothetical protein
MKELIMKIIKAIVVMVAAFFELCFTGRCVAAWGIARTGTNNNNFAVGAGVSFSPPPAPKFLKVRRSIVTAAVTIGLAVFFTGFAVQHSNQPHQLHNTEDDQQKVWRNEGTPRTATDGPSSTYTARKAVSFCLAMFTVSMVTLVFTSCKKPERKLDQ